MLLSKMEIYVPGSPASNLDTRLIYPQLPRSKHYLIPYVYKSTRCTKILVIRLYFPLDVLHVSDCISPSTAATL